MEKIKELYIELVDTFLPISKNKYGIFTTHQGIYADNNSILFVGRETRGQGNIIENYKKFNGFITGELGWLNDKKKYKYTKSPFWRVIGKSTCKITDKKYNVEIFEHIYWSNLYRIAPKDKAPNAGKVKNKQVDLCSALLLKEILTINPVMVVFLTDYWVDRFIQKWENEDKLVKEETANDKKDSYYNHSFYFKGKNKNIPALVLPHPQNKRSGASENDLARHIIDFYKIIK